MALKIIRDGKKPFLIRAEFSKVLTILCFLQAWVVSGVVLFLSISFQLDNMVAGLICTPAWSIFLCATYCYFDKTKMQNCMRIKVEATKEIYKITNDKNKALEDLSEIETLTESKFDEVALENLKDKTDLV